MGLKHEDKLFYQEMGVTRGLDAMAEGKTLDQVAEELRRLYGPDEVKEILAGARKKFAEQVIGDTALVSEDPDKPLPLDTQE